MAADAMKKGSIPLLLLGGDPCVVSCFLREFSRRFVCVALLVALAVGAVASPGWAATDDLEKAKEERARILSKLKVARLEKEVADREAQNVLCTWAPSIRDCEELKDYWGQVLDTTMKGVTIWALGPYLGALWLIKELVFEQYLKKLQISPDEQEYLARKKGEVDQLKAKLKERNDALAMGENLKTEKLACVTNNQWAAAEIGKLVAGTKKPGEPEGPAGAAPRLTLTLPKDQEVKANERIPFAVKVSGGTPPYSVLITSAVGAGVGFEDISATVQADQPEYKTDLKFSAPGTHVVLVMVRDDPVMNYQTTQGRVTFRVAEADVPATPAKLVSFRIEPSSKTLKMGESHTFEAFGTYSDKPDASVKLVGEKITWYAGPVFQAKETGVFSVSASYQGKNAKADVTVVEQAKPGGGEAGTEPGTSPPKPGKPAPPTQEPPRQLTARLECGGLLEVVPGQGSKTCTVIVEGWRSNTADPVEVTIFPNPPPGGIVISGNTSVDPGNMYPAGVSDKRDEYPISQSFLADDSAPPGTTPFQIVVRQRGAGTVTLPLTVIVLPKKGGPVGPAPGGAPGGPGVPAPTASATAGQLRARLECGGVLEVVPGPPVGKDCDVILEEWSRSSSERVEVELVYPRQTSGIEVTPGNTSAPPENMWPNSNNEYLFGEGFSARPNAPPGTTPIMVRVRQRGAGEVMLSLNVTVLPKKGGPFGAVPAPAGGPGGAGLPAPTAAGTSGQLSAELDCGGSFELAPGDFAGRNCGIIVRGWRSSTTERVEVEVVYPRESSGIEVSPGNTSQDPGNMYSTSASDYYNQYVFSQTFQAKDNAPPGITPIGITVRQRGTGQIDLTLNVAVLKKGLLPSTGPGIRPPVTGGTGSGGEYCVWRYKPFGSPPECFGFDEAPCTSPRHNNPRNGYELERPNMTAYEAVALATKLSSYYDDKYGCRSKAAEPTTKPATPSPDPPDSTPPTGPTGPTGPAEEPTGPTGPPPRVLSRFGVSCEPKTIVVGESASCTASGEYSDEHGKYPILTGAVAWTGGPTVRGEKPGPITVTASLEGASDTATVTVLEVDLSWAPPSGGEGEGTGDGEGEGTPFDPTKPKDEPNQPGAGGPLDVPVTVTPGGPTDGQPPGGEKPPKDGKPGARPPAPVGGPYRPPTTTNTTLPPRPPPIVAWCKNPITGAYEPCAHPPGPIVQKRPPTPPTTLPPVRTPPTTLPPVRTPPTTLPPAKTPPGAQDVDLSGTWHATYSAPLVGDWRYTMTLSRIAAGKWQGPLDVVNVSCPELNFKTQATLQATGVGKVRLTYNTPEKDCPRHAGRLKAGAQQADGTYTNSQITFGVSPNTVTYTRK